MSAKKIKTTGWFRVSHDLVRSVLTRLSGSAVKVLLCLASYAGGDGECWPSHQRIAADVGLSTRSVIRSIAELEKEGVVEVHRARDGRTANRYRVSTSGGPGAGPCCGEADGPGRGDTDTPGSGPSDKKCVVPLPTVSAEQEPGKKTNTPPTPRGEVRVGASLNTENAKSAAPPPPVPPPPAPAASSPPPAPRSPSPAELRESRRANPMIRQAFEAWYASHPRQGNREDAWRQWLRIDPAEYEKVRQGHARWRNCDQWRRGYVTGAAKWLRNRAWDDCPLFDAREEQERLEVMRRREQQAARAQEEAERKAAIAAQGGPLLIRDVIAQRRAAEAAAAKAGKAVAS